MASRITSKDFVFTWKAIMDPGNAPISRSGYDKIASIDTPDDHDGCDPLQSSSIRPGHCSSTLGPNNIGGGLLPAHIFEGKTALEKDPEIHQPTWAGGPFMIKEWVAGDHMTLVPQPQLLRQHSQSSMRSTSSSCPILRPAWPPSRPATWT